ncbi:alpha/beta fold hydrolase [Spirillospora sp. CA-128828]|uniref:alpha/beta fold hydrolase n=1 Tax=Spirillospora sp. CA-128828 TaxID=3240033 RepID=UPI003D8F9B7B
MFIHGLLTNGTLWRNVADGLHGSYRCLVPDWPLGGHTAPVGANVDLSPRGVARIGSGGSS